MSRTPLLVACALLALAALTVGGAGHATPGVADGDSLQRLSGDQPVRVVDVSNTTNYLFPGSDSNRQAYVRANVDVSSALAASGTRLDSQLKAGTLDTRLSRASSGKRLAIVQAAVTDAERRLARLNASQRTLYQAYNNGTFSRQQFLRQLVRLEVRATELEQLLDRLETSAEAHLRGSLPASLETRLASLRSAVVVLPDPLTERMRASVLGNDTPLVVYTEGADDAVVLATIDGPQYRRQATLLGEHHPDTPDQFEQGDQQAIAQVVERTTELYPWAYSNDRQFSRRIESIGPATSIYRIEADHPQGSLASYISGSTTNAFHEIQTLDPATVPIHRIVSNETATLNVTVTTTTESGPMYVELATPAGVPQNGTVFVDGQPVGTTGSDGSLWTVRPSGPFALSVVGENGERVSLTPVRFLRTS